MSNPLDAIQARADAATEGPWKAKDVVDEDTGDLEYSEILHDYKRESGGIWPNQILGTMDYDSADAEFIAHAREDVPKLVGVVRAVEKLHWRRFHNNKPSTCHEDGKHWPCPTRQAIGELP